MPDDLDNLEMFDMAPVGDVLIPRVPVEDLEEGKRRRDAALDKHEQADADRLDKVRTFLIRLYLNRLSKTSEASVSADDARKFCDENGIGRGKWMGAIFRGPHWQQVGWTLSTEPQQHARGIRTWKYV